MDLMSSSLLDAVIALTVVSVALTLWLWPRLARRGVLWIMARLGMILMSQLSLVLVVALMINSYGDFYPTWGDLVGGGNQQVAFGQTTGANDGNTEVGAGPNGLITPDATSDLGSFRGLPSGPADQVGETTSVHIHGLRSRISDHAYVYLPPQYFQPAYAHTAFPVITSYTGFPGEVETSIDHLHTIQQFATLVQDGQIQPTILVVISQDITEPRDNDCLNLPHGGAQVETLLTTDYVAAVKATYRVTGNPRGWGLEGYSEGGTCALVFAMRYPQLFSVVGDLGGDYADVEDSQTGNLFGPKGSEARTALMNQYNLGWRLKHLPVPDIQVLLATSMKESDYKATEAFLREVKAPMSATPALLKTGGHNFGTWNEEQGPTMIWMSEHMSPPTAQTPPPVNRPAKPRRTPPAHRRAKGAGTVSA